MNEKSYLSMRKQMILDDTLPHQVRSPALQSAVETQVYPVHLSNKSTHLGQSSKSSPIPTTNEKYMFSAGRSMYTKLYTTAVKIIPYVPPDISMVIVQ